MHKTQLELFHAVEKKVRFVLGDEHLGRGDIEAGKARSIQRNVCVGGTAEDASSSRKRIRHHAYVGSDEHSMQKAGDKRGSAARLSSERESRHASLCFC